ncbi:hypothetical protein GQR58_000052 [Nymphon striatum]|nr:hypothetical protein GQR58_000052 [Nymphon striatum]
MSAAAFSTSPRLAAGKDIDALSLGQRRNGEPDIKGKKGKYHSDKQETAPVRILVRQAVHRSKHRQAMELDRQDSAQKAHRLSAEQQEQRRSRSTGDLRSLCLSPDPAFAPRSTPSTRCDPSSKRLRVRLGRPTAQATHTWLADRKHHPDLASPDLRPERSSSNPTTYQPNVTRRDATPSLVTWRAQS